MTRLEKYRQDLAANVAESETILARVDADGNLTEADAALIAGLEGKRATLGKNIEREDALAASDKLARRVASSEPSITHEHDRAIDQPWAETNGFGGFMQAVRRAGAGGVPDPRLFAAATGQGEAIGPDGGYAIPIEYAEGIEKNMWETGKLLSRVSQRPVAGNNITYRVVNETSRADGSRGGALNHYWLDEGEAPTASTMKLAKVELKLRKIGALLYATDELNEDAPALEAELREGLISELVFGTENAIFRGAGSSQPLGFMEAPCLVSVSKETNQAALTITTTNLSKMFARLPARSQANMVWLTNVDCGPQLDELSIAAGTAALEPRFVNYGPDGILRIKGREVLTVEYAETVGTLGDIVAVDLSQYRAIRKAAAGPQVTSSIHVRFVNGENTFRAIYRVDGQPLPRAAITPFKGTGTLSPFVALATRS